MRPPTVEEVAETTAINFQCSPQFDEDTRLRDTGDMLQICSSLVTLSMAKKKEGYENGDDSGVDYVQKLRGEVRVIHFFTEEYLVSDCTELQLDVRGYIVGNKLLNTLFFRLRRLLVTLRRHLFKRGKILLDTHY